MLFQSEGQQAQDPGRAAIWDPVQRKQRTDVLVRRQSGRKNSFLLRGGKRVALFRPHMIGSGPPALGRALRFAEFTDLNVPVGHSPSHRNTQMNV